MRQNARSFGRGPGWTPVNRPSARTIVPDLSAKPRAVVGGEHRIVWIVTIDQAWPNARFRPRPRQEGSRGNDAGCRVRRDSRPSPSAMAFAAKPTARLGMFHRFGTNANPQSRPHRSGAYPRVCARVTSLAADQDAGEGCVRAVSPRSGSAGRLQRRIETDQTHKPPIGRAAVRGGVRRPRFARSRSPDVGTGLPHVTGPTSSLEERQHGEQDNRAFPARHQAFLYASRSRKSSPAHTRES